MLYQGVNMPLSKLDMIVEHDGGRVATEEESEAMDEDDGDSDSLLIEDLVEGEKEDDGKTETKKKVLQNEKPEMSKCITAMAAQLTILFLITKAGDKRPSGTGIQTV
jgi:hypothetical protein